MNKRDHYNNTGEGSGETPSPAGWTKHELMTVGELSAKSFDTIRKAARVPGPTHGRLKHVFSAVDMFGLIQKAEGGRFTERGKPAAKAWRKLLIEAGIVMPEEISRGRR
jgi:hypothetical protein